MHTVGGVGSALFAPHRAAEADLGGRRAGRPEAKRACPGSPCDSSMGHHPPRRPTPRETKTGGGPTALARLRGDEARRGSNNSAHPPTPPPPRPLTWPGPRRSRHTQRPRPITSSQPLGGRPAQEYAGRSGLSPSEPPGPRHSASEPSARASAVPWSRASATTYPSRGNHRPHRPAAHPSTLPAARGVQAAPPSSCGLGLRSAEGTGAGPCLRTSTKEGCDARAAQPAQGQATGPEYTCAEGNPSPPVRSFAVRGRSLDHSGEGGAVLAGGGAFIRVGRTG